MSACVFGRGERGGGGGGKPKRGKKDQNLSHFLDFEEGEGKRGGGWRLKTAGGARMGLTNTYKYFTHM